jgi:PCI domain
MPSSLDHSLTESNPLTCHRLILTYLIPCHLLTTHTLPTLALLSPYPRLQELFLPLSRCIKKGDLSGFDAALVAGEDEFVKRRIYLTLERGRDIALRNLLRRVFVAGGFEEAKDANTPPVRRTRIPVAEFGAAISFGSKESMDSDEVECLLANMIYKVRFKSSFPSSSPRFATRCEGDASRQPPLSAPPRTENLDCGPRVKTKLTIAEFNERLHRARARDRGTE